MSGMAQSVTKPGKTPLGLEEAHRGLRISPAEFDEVAAELGRTLDFAKVPKREKSHPLDKITQTTIDLRPPCPISRFPTPERFKASAMPPQDSLRLNYLDHAEQVRPEPDHPYEQRPISAAQSKTRRCSPQSHIKLMP